MPLVHIVLSKLAMGSCASQAPNKGKFYCNDMQTTNREAVRSALLYILGLDQASICGYLPDMIHTSIDSPLLSVHL